MTDREISDAWEEATDPRLELTREHSLSRLMMAAALREASLRDLRGGSSCTLSTTDGVSLEVGLQLDGLSPGGGGGGVGLDGVNMAVTGCGVATPLADATIGD